MQLTEDYRENMIINWVITFFGGQTIIASGIDAIEAIKFATEEFAEENNFYGEVYSVIAYPFYL